MLIYFPTFDNYTVVTYHKKLKGQERLKKMIYEIVFNRKYTKYWDEDVKFKLRLTAKTKKLNLAIKKVELYKQIEEVENRTPVRLKITSKYVKIKDNNKTTKLTFEEFLNKTKNLPF